MCLGYENCSWILSKFKVWNKASSNRSNRYTNPINRYKYSVGRNWLGRACKKTGNWLPVSTLTPPRPPTPPWWKIASFSESMASFTSAIFALLEWHKRNFLLLARHEMVERLSCFFVWQVMWGLTKAWRENRESLACLGWIGLICPGAVPLWQDVHSSVSAVIIQCNAIF